MVFGQGPAWCNRESRPFKPYYGSGATPDSWSGRRVLELGFSIEKVVGQPPQTFKGIFILFRILRCNQGTWVRYNRVMVSRHLELKPGSLNYVEEDEHGNIQSQIRLTQYYSITGVSSVLCFDNELASR